MRKTLLTLSLLVASNGAFAAFDSYYYQPNFSYDYVNAYVGTNPTSYGVDLSSSFYDNTHLTSHLQTDFTDIFDASVGVGIHAPLSSWTDITADVKVKTLYENSLDFGFDMSLGLRQWITQELEVGGNVGYDTIKSNLNALAYARYYAIENLGVGVEVRNDAIADVYDYSNQVLFTLHYQY